MVKLVKISELRDKLSGFELNAEIIEIQPIRITWKCFKCGKKGLFKHADEFKDVCPACGETISTKKGEGLWLQEVTSALIKDDSGECYLDLWKEDILKFKVGDKVHLYDGFAQKNSTSSTMNVGKGKFGNLELAK